MMIRRLWFFFFFMLLSAGTLRAAGSDNLRLHLKRFTEAKDNTQLNAEANTIMRLLLAEGYGDQITFDGQSERDTTVMTVSYYAAEYLLACQDYDLCIDMGQRALPLTRGNGDYTWQSETLNILTLAYFYKTQYVDALNCAQQAYVVEEAHQDYERMSSTLNTTAGIYLGARQPWQAEQYIVKAIEADAKTADHLHANAIYGIAGEVYMGIGQYDKALTYARQAYEMERQRGNTAKAAIRQTQMASTYVVMGDTAHAHQLALEALPVLTANSVMPSLGICYNTLADVMRLEGRMDEAARYFNTACRLFEQTGDQYNRSHSLQGLARVLSKSDPQRAISYMEHFAALKDTIYYNDMRMLLTNYSAKFHNTQLSTANSQLSSLNTQLTEQNEDVHKTNRTIIIGGVIIVVLMLTALAFLIYAIRLKSRSNKFLLDLQHTRENFFTNITHEFRTPLTVILGLSRQLKTATDTRDTEQIHTAGEMIEREGSQLLLLINQLLDLSKMQANMTQPDWRQGNVVAYLNMVMETFYDYAHGKGVELVYAPHENEVVMNFVPDYMTKIVNNLISNAIKFTPQGGHVYVTTRLDGSTFIMQVADDGGGIDRQQLDHIFEPFYQADTDSQNIGTGVGLSIVKQIVTALQGTISVASSRGKGTVFTIHLPVAESRESSQQPWVQQAEPDVKAADTAMPELIDSETTESDEQTRILIIEDNRDVAYYIGSQLRPKYEIFYAINGRMALEKAQRLVPDLILTDLMMPEMDGLELCRQIRGSELLSHIPIIIITARSTNEDLIRGLEAGADAYLMKPFDSDELQVRVSKLLEQRRMLREKLQRVVAEHPEEDQGDLLSTQDAHFIGRLTDVVYSLMGRGQSDVDTVASTLCMSPSQLRRKVQAITGKTPAAYILQIRLSNAQRLLDKSPELTMGDVAYRCGFSDQAHFSHAFQKAFGMSPSQWSRRAK